MCRLLSIAVLLACAPARGREIVDLPVEVVGDPDLVLEIRDARLETGTYDLLDVELVVLDPGARAFHGVGVEIELLDARYKRIGATRVPLVGARESVRALYPGCQVGGFVGGWREDWRRPVRLRATLVDVEPVDATPPRRTLAWSANAALDVVGDEVAIANHGTTPIATLDVVAVLADGNRLGIPANFSPPLAPGDRRLFARKPERAVRFELGKAHAAW